MSRFAILLAGRIDATPALRAAVGACRVIAADAGIVHAAPLGASPELWVGDFDSAPNALRESAVDIPREEVPAEKATTDGEIAITRAIERGATNLLLVGALGGPRSDHAFAHLVLALRYARDGLGVELFDGIERGWPLAVSGVARCFKLAPGTQFSILKFSDVSGLTIEGAKYPLEAVELPFESILTQSNESLGRVMVTLGHGTAFLLAQENPKAH